MSMHRWFQRFVARFERSWLGGGSSALRHTTGRRGARQRPGVRTRQPLSFERLEDRTLLAPFTVTNNNDNGPGSLRQAVLDANALAGADTITFQTGLSPILLTTGAIGITQDLTITGNDFAVSIVQINAQDLSRLFTVSNAVNAVTFDRLSLVGGRITNDDGGAIGSSQSTGQLLTIRRSELISNEALGTGDGGAVSTFNGSIVIEDSTLTGNTAGDDGGAVYVYDAGDLTLTRCMLINNTAGGDGGATYTFGSTATTTVTASTLRNNTAGDDGGAIVANSNSSVVIANSTLSGNHTTGSDGDGGAVYASGAVSVLNCTFNGNYTLGVFAQGGAIALLGTGSLTVVNSTLSGNQLRGNSVVTGGGAIYTDNGDMVIVNSTITLNTAGDSSGGGIDLGYDNAGESLTIINSIIAGNTAATNPDFTAPGTFAANLRVRNSLIGENDEGVLTTDATAAVSNSVQTASFVGSNATPINPMLGGLTNNGGPTQTHALLAGSLALNSGDSTRATTNGQVGGTAIANDQRGAPFHRTFGAAVDMGGFESQSLVSIVGNTATFVGTTGTDALVYNIPIRLVRVNVLPYLLPTNIDLVTFDGLGQGVGTKDRLDLHDPVGNSTAQFSQGTILFEFNTAHVGQDFIGTNLEDMRLYGNAGGGTNIVTMTGSAGSDKFFARPGNAVLFNPTHELTAYTVAQISGDLVSGANDLARFFDSAGVETLTASAASATIVGPGYTRSATNFDLLLAEATVGSSIDVANLTGSAGVDALTGGLGASVFSVGTVTLQALGFETVTANGVSGVDRVQYTGSALSETFTAMVTTSSFVGTGFSVSVTNFDQHRATAGSGANDVADLFDSTGADSFVATGNQGTLSGVGFLQQATGFDIVNIRGINGGVNTRSITNPLAFTLNQFGTWV